MNRKIRTLLPSGPGFNSLSACWTGQDPCPFCSEIQTGVLPQLLSGAYSCFSSLCYKSTRKVLLPSASPLTAGHLLVVPRSHVGSVLSLHDTDKHDFLNVLSFAQDTIASQYCGQSVYLFEHGVGTDAPSANCGIDHAHLHVLPLSDLLVSQVSAAVLERYPASASTSIHKVLAPAHATNDSYLLFGSPTELYFVQPAKVPSQFMRRALASELQRRSWDWRDLTGQAEFAATLDTLATHNLNGGDPTNCNI